jgi:hypothetical protein
MKTMGCQILCCSRCRHYSPEGRRGGHCSQLGVPVQGRWNACSLSMPVFSTPLPDLSTLEFLPQPIEIHLPEPALLPEEVPTYAEPRVSHPAQSAKLAA